jgi:hypothetical protein
MQITLGFIRGHPLLSVSNGFTERAPCLAAKTFDADQRG